MTAAFHVVVRYGTTEYFRRPHESTSNLFTNLSGLSAASPSNRASNIATMTYIFSINRLRLDFTIMTLIDLTLVEWILSTTTDSLSTTYYCFNHLSFSHRGKFTAITAAQTSRKCSEYNGRSEKNARKGLLSLTACGLL